MEKSIFEQIIRDGFEMDIEKDLRCPKCNSLMKMTRTVKILKVVFYLKCANEHKYEFLEYLIELINIRDGAFKKFLNTNCTFKEP